MSAFGFSHLMRYGFYSFTFFAAALLGLLSGRALLRLRSAEALERAAEQTGLTPEELRRQSRLSVILAAATAVLPMPAAMTILNFTRFSRVILPCYLLNAALFVACALAGYYLASVADRQK